MDLRAIPAARSVMGWRLNVYSVDSDRTTSECLVSPAKENTVITFNLYTQIHRPLKQVFSFVSTPENDFQWQYGTLASDQVSEGAVRVGTVFHTVSNFMGRRIESLCEVTDYEPNQKYGFKSLSGPLHLHTLYTFEIAGTSTRVSIATHGSPEAVFETSDAILEKKVRKQCKENLAILKIIMEGG